MVLCNSTSSCSHRLVANAQVSMLLLSPGGLPLLRGCLTFSVLPKENTDMLLIHGSCFPSMLTPGVTPSTAWLQPPPQRETPKPEGGKTRLTGQCKWEGPDPGGSVGLTSSHKAKGHRFNFQLGQVPALWARSPAVGVQEAANGCFSHTSVFLALSFSLPCPHAENK